MKRPREFMDKNLAFRLLDEIAEKNLTREPIQLHLMGEPLLHPNLFEIIDHIHRGGLTLRLFTNGALLTERIRQMLYEARTDELVIGIHTFTENLYRDHRRGKPDFATYMSRIRETIEDKFRRNSRMKISLEYLNAKHFNQARREKDYAQALLPLVDRSEQAFRIIGEWKEFGIRISEKYQLGFMPVDLEGLQGPFRDNPLGCLKGNHVEILPGVILHFKDISLFSDYLAGGVRYVERYQSSCDSIDELLAVQANGDCTPCCVDYDGRIVVGSALTQSLESIGKSNALQRLQAMNRKGYLPAPLCRVCKAILVQNDYVGKFGLGEEQPFELLFGWYPLESDGPTGFRWTGKRAALILSGRAGRIVFRLKNGHPRLVGWRIAISQGEKKKDYYLRTKEWETFEFKLKNAAEEGNQIILESEKFWIPAEEPGGGEDRRELGIAVQSIRLEA